MDCELLNCRMKAFWRVRIEAALAMAKTASEVLLQLFYFRVEHLMKTFISLSKWVLQQNFYLFIDHEMLEGQMVVPHFSNSVEHRHSGALNL